MKHKAENELDAIHSRMTVLERQIMGRAGQWTLRNGKMYDEGLHAYVIHCACCKHIFLSQRCDKKTCDEKCKKKRLRSTSKTNFKKEGKNGQMMLGR